MSQSVSTRRDWRLVTRCSKHGIQACVLMTFRLQRPREVALTPPVCPKCEDVDGPQATIVSIEEVGTRS